MLSSLMKSDVTSNQCIGVGWQCALSIVVGGILRRLSFFFRLLLALLCGFGATVSSASLQWQPDMGQGLYDSHCYNNPEFVHNPPLKKVAFFTFFVDNLQIYVPIRQKITQTISFTIKQLLIWGSKVAKCCNILRNIYEMTFLGPKWLL